jgi:uncharacterized protein (DUF433 family)
MDYPPSPYIEERNGGFYVAGTRVSLDSVVIRFQEGASPEKIVQSFPTLKLSRVFGAIAYYLENQQMVNEHIPGCLPACRQHARRWARSARDRPLSGG